VPLGSSPSASSSGSWQERQEQLQGSTSPSKDGAVGPDVSTRSDAASDMLGPHEGAEAKHSPRSRLLLGAQGEGRHCTSCEAPDAAPPLQAKGSVRKHRPAGAADKDGRKPRWLPWRSTSTQQQQDQQRAAGPLRQAAAGPPLRALQRLQKQQVAPSAKSLVQLPVLGAMGFETEAARRALALFRRLHAAAQPQLQELGLVAAGAGKQRGLGYQAALLEAQRLYEEAAAWLGVGNLSQVGRAR
jgi:hypothetical protein